jgi:hypothetical protein
MVKFDTEAPAEKYTPEQKDAYKAKKTAESYSRKYRRAEKALTSAIRDLENAGFVTTELEANLEEVKERRTEARILRTAARVAFEQANLAALNA